MTEKKQLETVTEMSLAELGIEELDSRMEMAIIPLFMALETTEVNQTQCHCQHNYVAGCGATLDPN